MAHLADMALEASPLNDVWTIDPSTGSPARVSQNQRRRVCIYGAGYGHEAAPLDDPDWEVWALNVIPPLDSNGRLRADRWFELHEAHAQSDADMRWIAKCPVGLYVPSDLLNASPMAMLYPLERMEARYGSYWACTFAYRLALAIDEGFEDIGLFGVELAFGTERERTVEWACVSWWMGLAQGLGRRMLVPRGSYLGQHRYRYGLDYDDEKRHVERYLDVLRRGRGHENVGG